MSNLAAAIKSEISRLARKEVRSEIGALRKTVVQQRAHIAALRRQLEALERASKRSLRTSSSRAAKPAAADEDEDRSLRFRAAGLASHRKRLGLSASDFGRLLGVSGQSVYKWEAGEVKPRRSQLEAISTVRKLGKREALARLAELS